MPLALGALACAPHLRLGRREGGRTTAASLRAAVHCLRRGSAGGIAVCESCPACAREPRGSAPRSPRGSPGWRLLAECAARVGQGGCEAAVAESVGARVGQGWPCRRADRRKGKGSKGGGCHREGSHCRVEGSGCCEGQTWNLRIQGCSRHSALEGRLSGSSVSICRTLVRGTRRVRLVRGEGRGVPG